MWVSDAAPWMSSFPDHNFMIIIWNVFMCQQPCLTVPQMGLFARLYFHETHSSVFQDILRNCYQKSLYLTILTEFTMINSLPYLAQFNYYDLRKQVSSNKIDPIPAHDGINGVQLFQVFCMLRVSFWATFKCQRWWTAEFFCTWCSPHA